MARRGDSELRVRLTGDSGDFAKAMKQAADHLARTDARFKDDANSMSQALGRVGTQAKKTEGDVDQASKGIGGALSNLSVEKLDDVVSRSPLGGLASQLGGVGAAMSRLGPAAVPAVAALAGVTVGVTALAKVAQVTVGAFTDLAGSTQTLMQVTGLSAEAASGLEVAVRKAGVESDEFRDLMLDLSTEVVDKADQFEKWGVEIARTGAGTVDLAQTLYNLLDAAKALDDPTLQRDLLNELLGEDTAREALPLLLVNLEKIAEANKGAMSQEDIDNANKLNRAWNDLKTEAGLFAAEIGSKLVPGLAALFTAAVDVAGAVEDMASFMVEVAEAAASPITFTVNIAGDLLDLLKDVLRKSTVGDVLGNVGQEYADANREVKRFTMSLTEQASAMKSVNSVTLSAVGTVNDARQAQADATANLKDVEVQAAQTIAQANESAAQSVAQAQQRLADAHANAAKSIAAAEEQVVDAHADAAKSIAQAQERVADAVEGRGEALRDLAEAEVDAQELMAEAAEDANERIIDAERRLADAREQARRDRRDNVRKLEDAEQSLADAMQRALAEDDTVAAQRIREEALRDYNRTKEDLAEAETDINAGLRDAELSLRDAHVEAAERRADAEERASDLIGAARERVLDANERVAESERNLAETAVAANERIADAERNLADVSADAAGHIWQAQVNLASTYAQTEAARAEAVRQASASVWQARMNEVAATNALVAAQTRLQQALVNTALVRASLAFEDPGSRAMVASGISEFPGSGGPVYGIGRAGGGRVQEGQPYLIGGSHGLELFVPDGPGTVVPQRDLVGGGATNVFDFRNSVVGSERQLTEMVERAVRNAMVGGRR